MITISHFIHEIRKGWRKKEEQDCERIWEPMYSEFHIPISPDKEYLWVHIFHDVKKNFILFYFATHFKNLLSPLTGVLHKVRFFDIQFRELKTVSVILGKILFLNKIEENS